jgi:hypothetical protein
MTNPVDEVAEATERLSLSRDQDMVPELPPGLALNVGKSPDEIWADLNKHPLFMTELEDNDDVAALQALAYDGTPLENASNFKEQGNECFKAKKWVDAKEFYGKGIAIIVAEERRRAKGEPPKEESSDNPAEVKNEQAMLEQLFVNRAACHLELKNYRSCTLDCAGALKLNPKNVKAFYRSGKALLALDKIEEAEDACQRGLAVDPNNGALKTLAQDIAKKKDEVTKKREQEQARQDLKRLKEQTLKAALLARKIRTRTTEKPPEMEDARLHLVPDETDPTSSLCVPTVLLYPIHLQSDFIKAFNETESLEQHFGYVFPLPWDREGVYTTRGVECFAETVSGGLVKVGKKLPLLKVISGTNVELVDQLLKIFVVPQAKADEWVKEYKTKKAAEKK